MGKLTICVDFDGVLHSASSGWQGADVVADPPVPGAMEWLEKLIEEFDVAIYSARSSQPGGIEAMEAAIERWCLEEYGMVPYCVETIRYPTEKPAAFLTIDDRAICFEGDFGAVSPEVIKAFKPWNRR